METELIKLTHEKTKEEKRQIFKKVRRGSAPDNLNYNREQLIQDRIVQKQEELRQARRQQKVAAGALDELSNIVVSLAAVRYLLDHVQPENAEGENQAQQPQNNQDGGETQPEATNQAIQNILSAQGGTQVEQVAQMLLLQAAQMQQNVAQQVAGQAQQQDMAIQTEALPQPLPQVEIEEDDRNEQVAQQQQQDQNQDGNN